MTNEQRTERIFRVLCDDYGHDGSSASEDEAIIDLLVDLRYYAAAEIGNELKTGRSAVDVFAADSLTRYELQACADADAIGA